MYIKHFTFSTRGFTIHHDVSLCQKETEYMLFWLSWQLQEIEVLLIMKQHSCSKEDE